ncbi:MAG: transporter [Clostridia bacterium]
MRKLKEIARIIILVIVLTFVASSRISIADVGSFEDYDSGSSSWGSSDWDSSSWDYDYDYDSGSNYTYIGGGSPLPGIIIFIIIVAISMYVKSKQKNNWQMPKQQFQTQNYAYKSEEEVEKEVKAVDELFNKEEFLSWSRDLFVKLQEAWTARDWSTIRVFETNELFEQHHKQLQDYIDRKQINKMERICVKSATLSDFKQTGDKDVLTVILKSRMVDYIIDEETGKVLKGDKVTDRHSTYKLEFIRKTGVKTKPGSNQINTTNCPNCGAPTQITSSGKCEYCGSVITTGEHSWALANLEKIG